MAIAQTITHSTFSLEKRYQHSPAKVFAAFTNPKTKRRWFAEGEGFIVNEYSLDFRVGGQEIVRFQPVGGPKMSNITVYMDIVPQQRIIFAYSMDVQGEAISVSLTTIEFSATSEGTHLVFTEQGAYFEGPEAVRLREEGTRELLDILEKDLAAN